MNRLMVTTNIKIKVVKKKGKKSKYHKPKLKLNKDGSITVYE